MPNAALFKQLIDTDRRVVCIETDSPKIIGDYLWKLSMSMGWALYNWSSLNGLYRTGMEHLFIPRTNTPEGALSYVRRSNHFGIYLLNDFCDYLENRAVVQSIEHISQREDGLKQLVVIIQTHARVPAQLKPHITKIKHTSKAQIPIHTALYG
jgi:hypothetical protein